MTAPTTCAGCGGPLPKRRADKGMSLCRSCTKEHNRAAAAVARAEAERERERMAHLRPAYRVGLRDARRGVYDPARALTDPMYEAGVKAGLREGPRRRG